MRLLFIFHALKISLARGILIFLVVFSETKEGISTYKLILNSLMTAILIKQQPATSAVNTL